jgi:catechol 2,3-dioxygenase-like lactoylglutathione lyase family enzyme
MSARINHVAITSDHYAINARFYQALFGMKTGNRPLGPARAISIGDGYVGMTHIPRRDGRTSGLDHFGIEVDDIEDTIERMRKFDSDALKRPPIRPYAAYSAHDPDTNIFDLSQRNIGFQKDVYADNSADDRAQPRTLSHIALRTRNAERCAHFYAEVFGLSLLNRSDDNYYLSDGRVTLVIIPWKIEDYYGMDPARTGLDHIGFKVESVEQVKKDLEFLIGENPHMHGRPLGYGTEGEARLALFKKCPLGCHHFTDIVGVYIDVMNGEAH